MPFGYRTTVGFLAVFSLSSGLLLASTGSLLFVISLCDPSREQPGYKDLDSDEWDEEVVVENAQKFLNLQGILKKQFALDAAVMDLERSTVCSPVSALFSLGKLAIGSRGKCLNNILTAIGLSSKSQLPKVLKPVVEKLKYGPGVNLNVLSRIYVSKKFSIAQRFNERAERLFGTSLIPVDFHNTSVTRGINDFIRSITNNHMNNIIFSSEVSQNSSMVLVNTVYFTGLFKTKFDQVKYGNFFSPNEVERVPMMTNVGFYRYSRSADLDAQVVEIPYAGDTANLVIFLPNSKHGLPVLLQKLKLEPTIILQALETLEGENIAVTIPRFRIKTRLNLKNLFTSLGVAELFQPKNTCFNDIKLNSSPKSLYLSMAIQKTVVEVGEFGYDRNVGACTLLFIITVSIIAISSENKKGETEESIEDDFAPYNVDDVLGPINMKGKLRKHFAMDIALLNPVDNVVCSPEAALFPLGKLALGANGECLNQILTAVGLTSKTQIPKAFKPLIERLKGIHGVTLTVVSKIFISDKIKLKKKFIEKVHSIFESTVSKINFTSPNQVANSINTYISAKTGNKITELLVADEININSSMLLINVVCFTGEWKYHFTHAKLAEFHSPNATETTVMFSREGFYYYYESKQLDAKLVEIPYRGEQASLLIIMPNSKMGLPVLLEKIRDAPEKMQHAIQSMVSTDMVLTIPKFTIEAHLDLKYLFTELGVEDIFKTQKSGLDAVARTNKHKVHVSLAIQRVLIEIDDYGLVKHLEQGENILRGITDMDPTLKLDVDSPFIFFVKYQNEELLSGVLAQVD